MFKSFMSKKPSNLVQGLVTSSGDKAQSARKTLMKKSLSPGSWDLSDCRLFLKGMSVPGESRAVTVTGV